MAPQPLQYRPLTENRMGFMILFDLNDENSLTEAVHIHLSLESVVQKSKRLMKPVVYLVGNKSDKHPADSDRGKMKQTAQRYAGEKKIQFMESCAFEFKKVRLLFRHMLEDIKANPILWNSDLTSQSEPQRKSTGISKEQCVLH